MGNIDFDEYLQQMNSSANPTLQKVKHKMKDVDSQIDELNKIYINAEKQKYNLRLGMSLFVGVILLAQVVFFNYMVWYIIDIIAVKNELHNSLSPQTIEGLLDFLKFYISATVAELLGMFFFMIRYAFSKMENTRDKIDF